MYIFLDVKYTKVNEQIHQYLGYKFIAEMGHLWLC